MIQVKLCIVNKEWKKMLTVVPSWKLIKGLSKVSFALCHKLSDYKSLNENAEIGALVKVLPVHIWGNGSSYHSLGKGCKSSG